jgi:hypothetical protein
LVLYVNTGHHPISNYEEVGIIEIIGMPEDPTKRRCKPSSSKK